MRSVANGIYLTTTDLVVPIRNVRPAHTVTVFYISLGINTVRGSLIWKMLQLTAVGEPYSFPKTEIINNG